MKKLYMVDLTTTIAVMAESAVDAMIVAANNALATVMDSGVEPGTPQLVTVASELHSGWDDDCIPYGGDGNTSIKNILTPNVEVSGE